MFHRLKTTLSVAYLNGKNYINNELFGLDKYIDKLKNIINQNNTKPEITHDNIIEIRKINQKRKELIYGKIRQVNSTNKISDVGSSEFHFYSKLILTAEISGKTEKYNKTIYKGICERCGIEFKNNRILNNHIRNDNGCSIYYKLKYIYHLKYAQNVTLSGTQKKI